MTKKTKFKECLELVHTNMYGPFCVFAWKVWVFHHFTDKYFRFGYVYRKSDALNKFFKLKAESDNLLGVHTKSLRLNRDGMPSNFDSFPGNMGLYPNHVNQGLHCKMERYRKKISNCNKHSEINDWFLVSFHILLKILL